MCEVSTITIPTLARGVRRSPIVSFVLLTSLLNAPPAPSARMSFHTHGAFQSTTASFVVCRAAPSLAQQQRPPRVTAVSFFHRPPHNRAVGNVSCLTGRETVPGLLGE